MPTTERTRDVRVERCFDCRRWVRPTHVMHAGYCGTGTQRTVYCTACAPTAQAHATLQRVYRDRTPEDNIASEVEDSFAYLWPKF